MQPILVVVLALLLAGCVDAGPGINGPVPDDASGPLILADITSFGCRYNDIIFLVPLSDAQAHLPDGFVARATLEPDLGALVINFIDCTGGFAWSAADLFVMVEPPEFPDGLLEFDANNRSNSGADMELDLYMLTFHTDHGGLYDILDVAGIPYAPGRVEKTAVPGVAGLAQGNLHDGEGELVTYLVTGAEVGAFKVLHRQWHSSDAGILLFERFFTKDGGPVPVTQGPATCLLRAGSPFLTLIGDVPCALGQDVEGEWEWSGRAYLFPDDF